MGCIAILTLNLLVCKHNIFLRPISLLTLIKYWAYIKISRAAVSVVPCSSGSSEYFNYFNNFCITSNKTFIGVKFGNHLVNYNFILVIKLDSGDTG